MSGFELVSLRAKGRKLKTHLPRLAIWDIPRGLRHPADLVSDLRTLESLHFVTEWEDARFESSV